MISIRRGRILTGRRGGAATTQTNTESVTPPLPHSLTHSLTHSRSLFTASSFIHSLVVVSRSLIATLTHSLTHSLTSDAGPDDGDLFGFF